MTTKNEEQVSATFLTFASNKSFEQTIIDFEKQLGYLDQEKAKSSTDFTATVKSMEGPLGLMIIHTLEMDRLLPHLTSASSHARQYLVGNPLIASEMAQHNTIAALYAPPRVLIYTKDDQTIIAYEKPSTLFGRLGSQAILETGLDLDTKFEKLALAALN